MSVDQTDFKTSS